MKHRVILGLATLSICSFARAGDPGKAVDGPCHLYKIGRVIGLEIKNDSDKAVGEIDSVIVDSSNGRIAYAVVAKGGVMGVGEEKRLVPWEALKFTPVEKKEEVCVAHTSLTRDQISAEPAFKKNEPITAEMENKARETAKLPMDAKISRALPARLVCSTDLNGANVRATNNDEIGKIDEVVLDPIDGCVAYTVLASGGVLGLGEKHFALPWQMTEVAYDKDQKVFVKTPLDKVRFENAPVYNTKEWNRMSSPAYMKEVCKYHGTEPYWMHASSASARQMKEQGDH